MIDVSLICSADVMPNGGDRKSTGSQVGSVGIVYVVYVLLRW